MEELVLQQVFCSSVSGFIQAAATSAVLYGRDNRAITDQGARVTAHYNTKSSTLEPLLAEYGPSRIKTAQAELSREEDVIRMFAGLANAEFGPVQVLIVNHGYYPPDDVPVAQMSLEQWNSTMASNLASSFLTIREYLRHLEHATDVQKDKASIVMVGSTAGKYGEIGHADYSASKSGMGSLLSNVILSIMMPLHCSHDVWVGNVAQE